MSDEATAMDVDSAKTISPLQPGELSLNVLILTDAARNMHGLRHQDYQRYRQYCTRKVRRLRQICKITQSAARRKYEKKDITSDIVTSERHLQIPLFEAEAGWAYAMELKGEIRDDPRKRFHLLKRLRRAVEAAKKLLALCGECQAEGRTMIEVEGYTSLMIAQLLFEEEKWEQALKHFAKSRVIFEKLSRSGGAQREALCQKAMDTIDPSIRFCAYNLKIKGAQTLHEILQTPNKTLVGDLGEVTKRAEALLSDESELESSSTHITWRGKSIPTANEELAKKVQNAREMTEQILREQSLADARAEGARFGPPLDILKGAIKLAKADIRADELATAKVKSSKSEKTSSHLQSILAYIMYERQKVVAERAHRQVEVLKRDILHRPADHHFSRKAQKPHDIIRIYEAVERDIKELHKLPVLQSDVGLQAIFAAHLHSLAAQKSLFIGQDLNRQRKVSETLSLFEEASSQIADGRAEADAAVRYCQAPDAQSDLQQLMTDLQRVDGEIRGSKIKQQANSFLLQRKRGDGPEGVANKLEGLSLEDNKPPLSEQLDVYRSTFDASNPNLVRIPPAVKAVPYKPLFFDVAFNGIQYSVENLKRRAAGQELQPAGQEQESGKGKGLLGVIGGLWGRK
ncbi:hypothetical protein DFS34DRAFT_708311 [Phlyctochytrium arcticum]|nr:hypothetical protein DFS34DRAFT_708311 [Phlyctochytrium arcticum]